MQHVLNPEITRHLQFLLYRYRFIACYVIIGFLSIVVEIVCFRALEQTGMPGPIPNGLALMIGVLFAFWGNVRFNFKIPAAKRNRALFYFVAISAASAAVNFGFKRQLEGMGWNFEEARLFVAGLFFLVGYTLHRRFSFVDYKKVGVAIYANGIEDIAGIHKKISVYPDFIHVDVIDETFGQNHPDPRAYRMEVIRAYWPNKEIHVHIMSKRPSKWIEEIAPFVDLFFFHLDIDEDVVATMDRIHALKKKAGICVAMNTPLEPLFPHLERLDAVMLLAIAVPGLSGQKFDMDALTRIRQINAQKSRRHFSLCVDGGVNEQNVGLLNVENVVSGSSVLNSPNPIRQIMRLQTSSNYEST